MGQCRYQKEPKTGAEAERGQIGLLFWWPLCQATQNREKSK